MDSHEEKFLLQKQFPFEVFKTGGSTDTIPVLHWHECLEINYILGGSGYNVIGDNKHIMKPGEIYIINNSEHHYAFSTESLEMIVIIFDDALVWSGSSFDYEYLKPFFERKINFCNLISPDNSISQGLGALINEIVQVYDNQQTGYQLVIKASMLKILALLYRHFKLENQIDSEILKKKHDFERIKLAVEHIDKYFTSEISLHFLSRLVFMNPNYFSTYFKKVMHMSLTEYTTALRINHAGRLLKKTSYSVTEICSECGFKSLSHFNRTFKGFTGLNPSDYKKYVESVEKAKD